MEKNLNSVNTPEEDKLKREQKAYQTYREFLSAKRQLMLIKLLLKELSAVKTEDDFQATLKNIGMTEEEVEFYID